MGKWLNRLNARLNKNTEKVSKQEVTKVTKGSFVTFVSPQSEHFQNLRNQLQRLQQQYDTCIAVKSWPHYRKMSQETKAAGDRFIERLRLEIEEAKRQIKSPL